MAQFEVPQFIELESKIIGPLSFKQFGFLAGGFFISFLLFFVLSTFFWVLVAGPIMAICAAFAFIKANGRPLYKMAVFALKFFWQPKLFLWKQPIQRKEVSLPANVRESISARRMALQYARQSAGKLSNLWRDITTRKTPIPKRERSVGEKRPIDELKEQFEVFRKITGEKEVAKRIDYR